MGKTKYVNYKGLAFIFELEDDNNGVEVTVFNKHYDAYDISRYSETDKKQHTFESTVIAFMDNFINNRINDNRYMRSLAAAIKPIELTDYLDNCVIN